MILFHSDKVVGYEEDDGLIVGDSFFRGKIIRYSGLYLLCNFLNIISLGLMYPFCVTLLMKELAKKTYLNGAKIIYKGDSINLLFNYLKWFFMTIITFGIYGIWAECNNTKLIVSNVAFKKEGDQFDSESNILFISSLLLLGLVIFLLILKLFLDKFL